MHSSTTGTRIASHGLLAPTYLGSAFCALTRQSQEWLVCQLHAGSAGGAAGRGSSQQPLASALDH